MNSHFHQKISSPATKPPTTEYRKKLNNISTNSQSILPKTVTQTDKKVPAKYNTTNNNSNEFNYSSLKCQNDAKNHSTYSNQYRSEALSNNTKSTSIQSKHLNGSYQRLTNKLNCCKGCSRDTDETNTRKQNANVISMPKLKNDTTKCVSHTMNSNMNGIYKLSNDVKRSIISATFRRNSVNANAMLRKSAFKHSLDDEYYTNGNARRQSFDDTVFNKTIKQHSNNGNTDNYHVSNSVNNNNQIPSNDSNNNNNKRLIKQMSLDEYKDTTARLRKLEMKMRKHKIDVLKYVNGRKEPNIFNDPKKLLAYQTPDNNNRTKLDPFVRTKSDCVYPKISIDNVLQNKNTQLRKNSSGGSYGVISASELYKLRTAGERVN